MTKQKTQDNAIKRPKSSYIIYTLSSERNKVIEDFKKQGIKFSTKEILIEMGNRWKNMSETDKEHYKKLAQEEKRIYEEKISKSVNNKYITGYQLYCNENMNRVKKENPDLEGEPGFKYIQILANEWKHLDKQTAMNYNKRSDEIILFSNINA